MSSNIQSINDKTFKSEVIDYNGFVLVDFWAEWCEPCKNMMLQIEQLVTNIKKEDHIKICKFNISDGNEIPSEYEIRSIPTLIIFKHGKEIARKIGLIENLKNWVNDKIKR